MKHLLPILLAGTGSGLAKLPELDAIFWGNVHHQGNQLLVPASSGTIVIQARLNGIILSQTSLAAGSSQFVLKVPIDDGLNPRLLGTGRAGERVRIFVRSNPLAVEFEATESVSSAGLPISATKGDLVSQNLSVSANLSGGAPAMAMWLQGYGLSSGVDSDGDGILNEDEYDADTDPTDSAEKFNILEVSKGSPNNFVKFGPIRPNRLYTVWSSPTMGSGDWTQVGQITPGVSGDFFIFGHPSPASPRFFYKLEVAPP